MVKKQRKRKNRFRHLTQVAVTAATNSYVPGFLNGSIYTGPTKYACVPGLSCYSCPGAVGACPMGALQAVIGSREFSFSFYMAGFFTAIGALWGRFVCGWLCPFGLIQDFLHKIPFIYKFQSVVGDRYLKYLRFGILIGFAILFPLFVLDIAGQGQPGFCKWICPAGTVMAGWPLAALNTGIRASLGFLFAWKSAILVLLILLSILVYRPFCRYLCPLGAIYGLFNPISFSRYRINENACTKCGACQKACKLSIPVYEKPNSMDCIRCGDCIEACPHNAIENGIARQPLSVYDRLNLNPKQGD